MTTQNQYVHFPPHIFMYKIQCVMNHDIFLHFHAQIETPIIMSNQLLIVIIDNVVKPFFF